MRGEGVKVEGGVREYMTEFRQGSLRSKGQRIGWTSLTLGRFGSWTWQLNDFIEHRLTILDEIGG